MLVQFKIMILQLKKYYLWFIISIILFFLGILSLKYYNYNKLYIEMLMGIVNIKKYNVMFLLLIVYDLLYISVVNYSFVLFDKCFPIFLIREKRKKISIKKIMISVIFSLSYFVIKDILIFLLFHYSYSFSEFLNKYIYTIFLIISLYTLCSVTKRKIYLLVYYIIMINMFVFYNKTAALLLSVIQLIFLIKKQKIKDIIWILVTHYQVGIIPTRNSVQRDTLLKPNKQQIN